MGGASASDWAISAPRPPGEAARMACAGGHGVQRAAARSRLRCRARLLRCGAVDLQRLPITAPWTATGAAAGRRRASAPRSASAGTSTTSSAGASSRAPGGGARPLPAVSERAVMRHTGLGSHGGLLGSTVPRPFQLAVVASFRLVLCFFLRPPPASPPNSLLGHSHWGVAETCSRCCVRWEGIASDFSHACAR